LYSGFGPVMQQPRWLMLIELFLLVDLMSYLSHRASHRVPWLWRFHAVHHSPRKVHWTSTARLHPVNDLVTYVALILPPLALGFPVDALAPLAPARTR
jgi:sterol desaturase/sphingolipid hydroxylase (fatty acid hydroxylase superfamily)